MNPQKPETRLDLVDKSITLLKEMSEQIVASGFVELPLSRNPVDVLTNALQKLTGFPR